MKRKLLIYDGQWAAYSNRFAALLGESWQVRAGTEIAWLRNEIGDADAMVALSLPDEVLASGSRLKAFFFPGAGLLESDPHRYPAGCAVCNVYEHATAIAEFVIAAILLYGTSIFRYAATFRNGCWTGSGRVGGEPHREISGRTLGIIGYGTIGQGVASRARALGLRTHAVRENRGLPLNPASPQPDFLGTPADLPRLLEESDFLLIACPLTAHTRGLLGASELRRMKTSAVLINVARAEIVDERALFEALRDGRIAGAALDVWYRYPASVTETLHGSALPFHELPNVLATPHMSGWTLETVERRISKMVDNLKRLERGEALERIVLVGTRRAQ